MLQSHENWKIEHSQITRNPPSSKLSLADLVVKEPGDEGHRLGGVGHEALQLHLYKCTVKCVLYSTGLTSLPSLTWMSGSPRMEAEGVTTTSRTRLQGAITHWAGTNSLC